MAWERAIEGVLDGLEVIAIITHQVKTLPLFSGVAPSPPPSP